MAVALCVVDSTVLAGREVNVDGEYTAFVSPPATITPCAAGSPPRAKPGSTVGDALMTFVCDSPLRFGHLWHSVGPLFDTLCARYGLKREA